MWRYLIVVSLLLLGGSYQLWYPGLSRAGTARILLDDTKFGGRAIWKARLHGPSILMELSQQTNGFENIGFQKRRIIVQLLNNFDLKDSSIVSGEFVAKLESQPGELITMLIQARSGIMPVEGYDSENLYETILRPCSTAVDMGMRCDDYKSETAMYIVANLEKDAAIEKLVASVSREGFVSPWRKEAACDAIREIKSIAAQKAEAEICFLER